MKNNQQEVENNNIIEEDIVKDTFQYYITSPDWKMLTTNTDFGGNGAWVKDYRNTRFGKMVPILPFKNIKTNDPAVFWLCKCDCGNFSMYRVNNVPNHTSCGCDKQINHIGERHGHLECIKQNYTGYKINDILAHRLVLVVKCDCGYITLMSNSEFQSKVACSRDCKYSEWNTKQQAAKNGKRIKQYFKEGTNISKIGSKVLNKNNTSGFKGVYFDKTKNKYLSYISFQGKNYRLGYYDTPEYASNVRNKAQDILSKEFLDTFNEDEFVQNNKHLKDILEKAKNRLKIK